MSDQDKQKAHIQFTLNGEATEVAFAPHKTLLEVLREDLESHRHEARCELGECGTCAVLVDGRSILSCLMLGLDAEGREVKTIEGMADGRGASSACSKRLLIWARRNVVTVRLVFCWLLKSC